MRRLLLARWKARQLVLVGWIWSAATSEPPLPTLTPEMLSLLGRLGESKESWQPSPRTLVVVVVWHVPKCASCFAASNLAPHSPIVAWHARVMAVRIFKTCSRPRPEMSIPVVLRNQEKIAASFHHSDVSPSFLSAQLIVLSCLFTPFLLFLNLALLENSGNDPSFAIHSRAGIASPRWPAPGGLVTLPLSGPLWCRKIGAACIQPRRCCGTSCSITARLQSRHNCRLLSRRPSALRPAAAPSWTPLPSRRPPIASVSAKTENRRSWKRKQRNVQV